MIGEVFLLLAGFLLGRRAFWASFAYVLGVYQALGYPMQLMQFLIWLILIFIPKKLTQWIRGSMSEIWSQYGADASDLMELELFGD
nr:MAG: small hydrophobic protein [Bat tupavirus CX1]